MNAKTKTPAAQDFKDCARWGKGGSYVVDAPGEKRVLQTAKAAPAGGTPTALSKITLGSVVMGEAIALGQTSAEAEASTENSDVTTTTTTPSPSALKLDAGNDHQSKMNKEPKRA